MVALQRVALLLLVGLKRLFLLGLKFLKLQEGVCFLFGFFFMFASALGFAGVMAIFNRH